MLLAKPRSRLEVYNDLDGDMVNLFRVLRDQPDDLVRQIALTPFAREEHQISYEPTDNPVERARRVLVRSHFGHGSSGIHRSTGFRAAGIRAGTLPVHIWARMHEPIAEAAERMMGVVIERRPALQIIATYDAQDTVMYVDPPYLPETRDKGRDYRHEMTRADHTDLLDCLTAAKGKIVLSGYDAPLYNKALKHWRRIEISTWADRAAKRVEVLWCNFDDMMPLFAADGGAP